MNKEIRSKNTYEKGKIVKILSSSVRITFVKGVEPMEISFDTFLENCFCSDEIKQIINEKKLKCDTSHEIE